MAKKRTIYDIASELGLAPGTISKVLNHTGNVSSKTRERVLSYIKQVGYVPTSSARMLKSRRTYTIGVVFTEESDIGLEHSFFSSILQSFKTYAENEGYELSFIVRKLGKNQLTYYEWCMNKRVDGVYIVVGDFNDQGLHEILESGIPAVSTDMFLPGLHTVVSDNDQGIRLTLEYIKNDLKKKHVAMVGGPVTSKAFVERLISFQKYTPIYKLQSSKEDIVLSESFGFTGGFNAVKQLMKQVKSRPEVILAASDDIALGVIKGLTSMGIKIPEEIQVIGFDDIAFAKHFTPSLTTIAQNRILLGQTAAKMLIHLIESPEDEIEEIITLPVELVERESTKR
ncbi:MAG: LacI family transcriptional regulator [Tenericutes bacterium HGW-Tenericutes-3]|nr:MAG: LacI family transcriptional regulator [Tenericutes bacterium HGW-Tenericutes-3]